MRKSASQKERQQRFPVHSSPLRTGDRNWWDGDEEMKGETKNQGVIRGKLEDEWESLTSVLGSRQNQKCLLRGLKYEYLWVC